MKIRKFEEVEFDLNEKKLKELLGLEKNWMLVKQEELLATYKSMPLPGGFRVVFQRPIR